MAATVARDAGAPLLARLSSGLGTCRSEALPPVSSPWHGHSQVQIASTPQLSPRVLAGSDSEVLCVDRQQLQQEASGGISFAACSSPAQFEAKVLPTAAAEALSGSQAGHDNITQFEVEEEPECGEALEEAVSAHEVAKPPCTEDAPAAAQVGESPTGPKGKPKLMLPLPRRCDMSSDQFSPARDVQLPPAGLPAPAGPGPSGLGSRRSPAALRSGRQIPARLQALDDQTVMPRDVYNNMLKLGEAARGRLGYGQHKLTFTGPEGVPVLRIAA